VSTITAVRENGGADLLYLTESPSHHLARGIHRTHFRRALLFLPAMIAGSARAYFMLASLTSVQSLSPQQWAIVIGGQVLSLLSIWVYLYAYVCLGCVASTWKGSPAMCTFKGILALLGAYIAASFGGGILMMVFMFTTIGQGAVSNPSNIVAWTLVSQIAMSIPYVLVLLTFGRAWQSAFGRKLARHWRTGAEV